MAVLSPCLSSYPKHATLLEESFFFTSPGGQKAPGRLVKMFTWPLQTSVPREQSSSVGSLHGTNSQAQLQMPSLLLTTWSTSQGRFHTPRGHEICNCMCKVQRAPGAPC